MRDFEEWVRDKLGTDTKTLIDVLEMSPSSQGYIQGAVSELDLMKYLNSAGFKVWRIKEEPAGALMKKDGYRGDFSIKNNKLERYVGVECNEIKTNAEFRSG